MLKLFVQPQVVVLAALGSLACGMAALIYEGGYRRGPVGLAVPCIFVSAILPLLIHWGSAESAVILLISLISGCMALATVFLVPLLTIAGLSDRSCPLKTRLRQAAFVISAWVLGCGWIFLGVLGLH